MEYNRLEFSAAAQPTNLRPVTVNARGTAVFLQLVEVGPGLVHFAITRRTTLAPSTKQVLECNGCVITVYKQESLVAPSKGSFRSGRLRAIQSEEDWNHWILLASIAALKAQRESVSSAEGAVMRAQEDRA